ncbi:YbjN domain-containing protein [Pseudomonas sp. F1_0610]|uniref:YbjN domain-containing protein n=1 Tax=Pseudomonas sp. F1_0610 TaxID=3114284 RepID=UPI0039C0B94B
MLKQLVGAAALSSLLLATPLYAAQVIDNNNTKAILAMAQEFGTAELSTDDEGDPLITGRMNETDYSIIFHNCQNGKNCTDLMFSSAWSASGNITLEQVNTWNSEMLYGQAYLDGEKDPTLEMSVNIDGGVTEDNLRASFQWWNDVVPEFESTIFPENAAVEASEKAQETK